MQIQKQQKNYMANEYFNFIIEKPKISYKFCRKVIIFLRSAQKITKIDLRYPLPRTYFLKTKEGGGNYY